MKKFTVQVQRKAGSQVTPVCVEARDITRAIENAAEYLALHGEIHSVRVFDGHDGYYQYSEAVWTGSLTWSMARQSDCVMHPVTICPGCGKRNELADEIGACDGPREYHAGCWTE